MVARSAGTRSATGATSQAGRRPCRATPPMNDRTPEAALAPLLFFSGACALVYQIAWFREFRLVFGVSTAATGAVLALFSAGLGLGGLFFGERADHHPNPVALYARLELGIAISS